MPLQPNNSKIEILSHPKPRRSVRIPRTHSRIEPMNPPRRSIFLSSTYLWRRGLGRGGSSFDGRFMGRVILCMALTRQSPSRTPLFCTCSVACPVMVTNPRCPGDSNQRYSVSDFMRHELYHAGATLETAKRPPNPPRGLRYVRFASPRKYGAAQQHR